MREYMQVIELRVGASGQGCTCSIVMIARTRGRGKYQWVSTSDSDLVRVCVSAFFTRVYQVIAYSQLGQSWLKVRVVRVESLPGTLSLGTGLSSWRRLEGSWRRA
jgi:hypothetical protein